MQKRHLNREQYFNEQGYTTRKYVIPFIKKVKDINKKSSILEIGCGEGGNLFPFLERGCDRLVGVDLSKKKIKKARYFFSKKTEITNRISLICSDIYDINPKEIGQFDVIMLRDVIEHIHNQRKFMNVLHRFLKPGGCVFFGFPNWYMPFGGHQQICKGKFLSKLPYFHILPNAIYKNILKMSGEPNKLIDNLLEIKETGITIEHFERILKTEGYKKERKELYFINPNYEVKFGLKPRKSWRLVSSVPFLRNFFITANYYVVSKKVQP